MNKTLFALYLGGTTSKANIELHDIVFLVSDNIRNESEKIKSLWFGDVKGLHIDAIATINVVDGFKINLVDTRTHQISSPNQNKLFFINFGGTAEKQLNEVHESGFFVAENKSEAIKKAKAKLLHNGSGVHMDNFLDVDNCINLQDKLEDMISLEKNGGFESDVIIDNVYIKV